jgi:hypothetical protein
LRREELWLGQLCGQYVTILELLRDLHRLNLTNLPLELLSFFLQLLPCLLDLRRQLTVMFCENCKGCGSEMDNRETSPVGSFKPNPFGVYDMNGNVWEWVEDCYNDNYEDAPTDGSAWTTGDCSRRVARGGSWDYTPPYLRSAFRSRNTTGYRSSNLGFRIQRTLIR